MADMDEVFKKLREAQPTAFKAAAKIADDPRAKPRDRTKARALLKKHLPLLRELCGDPSIKPEDRRELEALLRKLDQQK